MHKTNKTLEKGYKYTTPTFHYTHLFRQNIKNPRSIEDKVDKVVEGISKGIKSLFGKKNK